MTVETSEIPQGPWTLFNEPRALPIDRQLSHRLHLEFVTKGERDWPREAQLTEDLYRQYLKGLPYKQSIQQALNLFLTMRNIHAPIQKSSGRKAEKRSIAVMSGIQMNIISDIVEEHIKDIPVDFENKTMEQHSSLEATRNWENQWFMPKLHRLSMAIVAGRSRYQWMDTLKSKTQVAETGSLEEIRSSADQIWQRIQEERRYGIKTSYFDSELFLGFPKVFYITEEAHSHAEADAVEGFLPPKFAEIIILNHRPSRTPKHEDVSLSYESGVGVVAFTVPDMDIAFFVDNDGELKAFTESYGNFRQALAGKGYAKQYELLRLFLIMRLRDLTCSAEAADKLPSISDFEHAVSKGEGGILGIGKKIKKIDYKILSVPRAKSDEEINPKPEEPTEEQERKFVDKHHVTWFVRRLPKDYSPSTRAIEYALEHGITLKETETIVREHWRGRSREGQEDTRPTKAVFGRKNKGNPQPAQQ
ncbi:MAG: hypothetical protein HYU48_01235 [Candidatus Levybacteria bacterium]|nr:hypothetical protein [Candidatus Levybacteria bacterium]